MTRRATRAVPAQVELGDPLLQACRWSQRSAEVAVGHKDSVLLQEAALPGNLSLGQHAHLPGILCLVVAGGFQETCERRDREVGPAELVYYPPGARHAGRFAGGGSLLFSIDIPERLIDAFFGDERPSFGTLGPRLAGLMFRIRFELWTSDDARPLAMESLVAEVLAEAATPPATSPARSAWLPMVLEILRGSLRNPPTLAEIARKVDVDPCHLARAFRQTYHCTVGDYLRHLRVTAAAARLAGTSRTLTDIAYDAGFADQSHFGRVFKRIVGVTPGKYRALLR